ncbi:MAG: hypothetical protein KUG68_10785 [Flavobacteriaceae bacterium]|nr:hypothetical protein [Flavobacteriaceae bacterium]
MKKFIICFIALISISASQPTIITYDLKTAIEKKLVSCSFFGNDESTHYYQPVKIDITNLTNKNISIRIPNGQKFIADSTKVQDLIITQEELIALTPKKKELKPLFAMCIQKYKSASNKLTTYKLGDLADGSIKKISEEIEKNKSFNTLGQYTIWAITDEFPIEEIAGFQEKESIHYQKFVANLLNIPVPKYDSKKYETYYETARSFKRSVVGEFKYKFSRKNHVTLGLFNEQDIIVRELYNNPHEKPGKHTFNFAFDTENYSEPTYFIRMVVNGEVKINMKMEPNKRS